MRPLVLGLSSGQTWPENHAPLFGGFDGDGDDDGDDGDVDDDGDDDFRYYHDDDDSYNSIFPIICLLGMELKKTVGGQDSGTRGMGL